MYELENFTQKNCGKTEIPCKFRLLGGGADAYGDSPNGTDHKLRLLAILCAKIFSVL